MIHKHRISSKSQKTFQFIARPDTTEKHILQWDVPWSVQRTYSHQFVIYYSNHWWATLIFSSQMSTETEVMTTTLLFSFVLFTTKNRHLQLVICNVFNIRFDHRIQSEQRLCNYVVELLFTMAQCLSVF